MPDPVYVPPKELQPGFNEDTWKTITQCVGRTSELATSPPFRHKVRHGCGTAFQITRHHIFTDGDATEPLEIPIGASERFKLVWFICPKCGFQVPVEHANHFKGLPTKEQWLALHPQKPTHPQLSARTFTE